MLLLLLLLHLMLLFLPLLLRIIVCIFPDYTRPCRSQATQA
jgi:hypothetical protein